MSLVLLIVMILAHIYQNPTNSLSQQIIILHKTNKKNIFSELLAFWKVCSFTVYVLNTW